MRFGGVVTIILCSLHFVHCFMPEDDVDYVWKTTQWSLCSSIKDFGCGHGTHNRTAYCFDRLADEKVEDTLCKSHDRPITEERCFFACQEDKRDLQWQMGRWGPCEEPPIPSTTSPADGVWRRNVSCVLSRVGMEDEIVGLENCILLSEMPMTEDRCILPKNVDCISTEATEWSPCCNNLQFRTRTILVQGANDGIPCPQENEWRTCEANDDTLCPKTNEGYYTHVSKWGECRNAGNFYGNVWNSDPSTDSLFKISPQFGIQSRGFTCYNYQGEKVDLSLCGNSYQPTQVRGCIVPLDCAVSDWSEWVMIHEGCMDSYTNIQMQKLRRRREILRLPLSGGLPCPNLIEERELTPANPYNDLCMNKYKWLASKWGKCIDPKSNRTVHCGGGLQFRQLACVDKRTGLPISEDFCNLIFKPEVVQRCEIPCPRDCQVSEWSAWGPCLPTECPELAAAADTDGMRKRSRQVIVPASVDGIECPILIETQPCSRLDLDCYNWNTGPWGSCQLQEGYEKCGPGQRTRKVYCVTHTQQTVDDSRCLLETAPAAEENCWIACPYDCVTSEWSDWSPCTNVCSPSFDAEHRYRNRTIIGLPGPGGHPCPLDSELWSSMECNRHKCFGYGWMTLPWQGCNATCGDGFEKREVWCMRDSESRVPDDQCQSMERPTDTRECFKECEQPCKMSKWSEWSKCPKNPCTVGEIDIPIGGYDVRYSRRTRISLTDEYCAPLEEIKKCDGLDECPNQVWSVGKWSECKMNPDTHCGNGIRTRDVWCAEKATMKLVELRLCIANAGEIPKTIDYCHIDCTTSCALTEWTPWNSCKRPCVRDRNRTRELLAHTEYKELCHSIELEQRRRCPCDQYLSLPSSNWSSCIVDAIPPCGVGTRYRARECLDRKGRRVNPSLCYHDGIEEEPCIVPCPFDCTVTEWSKWGPCSASCGPGVQKRTRKVLTISSEGRKCPDTVEEKICDTPCSQFEWKADGWTTCNLTDTQDGQNCGSGIQYRRVWCMHIPSDKEVSEMHCDPAARPSDSNNCVVSCPGDCVLHMWSQWSPCPKGCPDDSLIQRTRSLIRRNSINGTKCPHSIEVQKCKMNTTCFTYQWESTPESSCIPLGGSRCGQGVISTEVYCKRSDGWIVDESYCNEEVKPITKEQWCYVDCGIDCALGGWTEWSGECKCNDTGISREAIVLHPGSEAGLTCDAYELKQWKPCPALPCYRWVTGPWTSCSLQGASCGHGITIRNVTCVHAKGGHIAYDGKCNEKTKPSSRENCHVPCLNTCLLTSWGEWGPCRVENCDLNRGYEMRTRSIIKYDPITNWTKPCLDRMVEKRSCKVSCKTSYNWQIYENGTIVCSRADGRVSQDGCDESLKPKPVVTHWYDEIMNMARGWFETKEAYLQFHSQLKFIEVAYMSTLVFFTATVIFLCASYRKVSFFTYKNMKLVKTQEGFF